jgi:hypothetical protein
MLLVAVAAAPSLAFVARTPIASMGDPTERERDNGGE